MADLCELRARALKEAVPLSRAQLFASIWADPSG
jgi:hypothetical protein